MKIISKLLKIVNSFFFKKNLNSSKISAIRKTNLSYVRYFVKQFLLRKEILNFKTYYQNSITDELKMPPRQLDVIVYKLVFKVTHNNVFITVVDPLRGYVFYASGGLKYLYLRKESVAVANIVLGETLATELISKFVNCVDVIFYGIPFKIHRLNFVKGLRTNGLLVRHIIDKTPIAHNGCDKKKRRRKKLRRR